MKAAEIKSELRRLMTDALSSHGFRPGGFKSVRLGWHLDVVPGVTGLVALQSVAGAGSVEVVPTIHVRHGAIDRRIQLATESREPTSVLACPIGDLPGAPRVVDWQFSATLRHTDGLEQLVGGRRVATDRGIQRLRAQDGRAVVEEIVKLIDDLGIPYMRKHATLPAIRDRQLATNYRDCPAMEWVWPALLLELGDVEAARTFLEDHIRRFNRRPDSSYATFARNLLAQATSA